MVTNGTVRVSLGEGPLSPEEGVCGGGLRQARSELGLQGGSGRAHLAAGERTVTHVVRVSVRLWACGHSPDFTVHLQKRFSKSGRDSGILVEARRCLVLSSAFRALNRFCMFMDYLSLCLFRMIYSGKHLLSRVFWQQRAAVVCLLLSPC